MSHKRVYLTARQVPTKPVEITYTVANAAGSSTGTIVLQPPALTAGNSAPKASNVNTQVRTDGIVSVNVLDHVSHSDGTTVTLQQKLQYDKDTFKGLVFVSGDTVRYQASKQTGVFPVTYTVKDNLATRPPAQSPSPCIRRTPRTRPPPLRRTSRRRWPRVRKCAYRSH